jgi:hypothetical protein
MEENIKKAFDFYADFTKQLITLSTAIIALSVTFIKDIVGKDNLSCVFLLALIWLLYIVSIIFGIMTLQALTGNLDPMPKKKQGKIDNDLVNSNQPILTINSDNVLSSSKLQIYTFIIGLILTCVFGYLNM